MSNKIHKKIYNESVQRIEGVKKIAIYVPDSTHAEFLIKVRYDELTQKKFFDLILKSYLTNDEHFMFFLNKKMEEKLSERRKRNKNKDTSETEKTIKNFGLDDEDIEDIFDIIEKENPDL